MRSSKSATHPFLWISAAVLALMTAMVLSSPLAVILDFYVVDDAFYYLKTAENFAAGHGSTFDGINHTNGYHPAWFGILALLYWLGVGHDAMVVVAIGLQAALFLAGLFVLARAFIATGVPPLFASAAIGIVFVGIVPALAWNLLEAGLTVLASATVLFALVRTADSAIRPFWLGLALSLASLTRTDHVIFVAIGGALFGWHLLRRVRHQWMAEAGAFMTPVVVLVGSYLISNFVTTGHFVQVSGLAKSVQSEWNSADYFADLFRIDVRSSWKMGAAGAIVILLRDARRRRLTGLGAYSLGALAIAAYYHLSYSEGFSFTFWYYVPLYVLLSYSLASTCQVLSTSLFRDRDRFAAAAMAVALTGVLAARIYTNSMYRSRPPAGRSELYQTALVLRDLARKPTDRIAAWNAGILGYYGGRVTNLDGLSNSADYYDRYLTRGRTPEYIREIGFDYIACSERDPRVVPVLGSYVEVFRGRSWIILRRAQ